MPHLRSNGALSILAVLAVYTLAHWQLMLAQAIGFKQGLFYWSGAVSLICMACAILLSVRPRLAEGWFGGLDRMYQVHKWLGITAMAAFLLHFGTSLGDGGGEAELVAGAAAEEEEEGGLIGPLGMYSMIGFFLLILLTLNRKFAYHRWIKTHLLMGLLFIAVSLHAFLVLQEGEEITFTSMPGLMILAAGGAGILAYLYKQTFFRSTRRHEFALAEVNAMERATELVLTPKGSRFAFEPGQFAFIRIQQDGFDEYHPFTISSGRGDGQIRFTMKVLGDFTRRVRNGLAPGAKAMIEGPYGRFMPLQDGNMRQVWIAGGIGITPFLSALRSLEPGHGRTVDLFYCVREEAEALFLDEIRSIAARVQGVTVHLMASGAGVRLTPERLEEALGADLQRSTYYFCGPKPLLAALSDGLQGRGVARGAIHFEEFEMR